MDDPPTKTLRPARRWRYVLISGGLAVAAAAVLVSVSVAATYAAYQWQRNGFRLWEPPAATTAMTCADRIDEFFSDNLVLRYLDQHSSRRESDTGNFAAFYRVDAHRANGRAGTHSHLVKCVTTPADSAIVAFEVYRL